uniref:Reverse transcriptase/retrotransposon-derived protein RNase H-like domain-containing protein n=1 Tax=Schizaphis graminum TaxID=13262 RepID=A0A2S2P614_SCHGA
MKEFSSHIMQTVKKALSISEMLKDGVPFKWIFTYYQSFQILKDHLVNRPILQLSDTKLYTKLHYDVSIMGLCGMIEHGSDERLHLVHAVLKKITSAERNYHPIKQELIVLWYEA